MKAIGVFLVLTLCAGTAASAAGRDQVEHYRCKDGTQFAIKFSAKNDKIKAALISVNGQVETLHDTKPSSGSMYLGKNYGYTENGGKVVLMKNGGTTKVECNVSIK